MAPQPRRQNPQHQALTLTLKNICRDYPPGGGILRELLQNADDAGASEMVSINTCFTKLSLPDLTRITQAFTLITRSYSSSNLLNPGLIEYQGPALLAYNDAKFLDKDFESLSSLGASRKEQEAFATGKFGRGFSSVESRLMILKAYVNENRYLTGPTAHLLYLTQPCSSLIHITHGRHHGILPAAQNGILRPMHRMMQ